MAKDETYYREMTNFSIATEILADPDATMREKILAQRIRGPVTKHHLNGSWEDRGQRSQHLYD